MWLWLVYDVKRRIREVLCNGRNFRFSASLMLISVLLKELRHARLLSLLVGSACVRFHPLGTAGRLRELHARDF